jgi:hypothetical protein
VSIDPPKQESPFVLGATNPRFHARTRCGFCGLPRPQDPKPSPSQCDFVKISETAAASTLALQGGTLLSFSPPAAFPHYSLWPHRRAPRRFALPPAPRDLATLELSSANSGSRRSRDQSPPISPLIPAESGLRFANFNGERDNATCEQA